MRKSAVLVLLFVVLLGGALSTEKAHAMSGCEVRTSLFSVPNLTVFGLPLCDVNGAQWFSMATLISGEDTTNLLLRVSGGAVRSVTAMTGVTTNTTSASFTIFSGGKTPIAQVSGAGAVTATVKLYGDNDSTAADGILLCTITMSGTTKVVAGCDSGTQFTNDYPFYYATTTNVSGGTVEFIVSSGIAGSVAGAGGSGGAVTNAGTFAVQANVTAINSVTPLMGAGNTGTGSQRVTEATDSQLSAGVGATGDAVVAFGATGSLSAKLRLLTNLTLDPCGSQAKSYVTISQTTGTQLFTGTASMRTYVCAISIFSATTQNIAIVSGTGTVCATGTGAMYGGTTAATGWNFVANQGTNWGDGKGAIMKSKVDADNICILMSSTGQLSGVISYVAAAN